MLKSKYIIGVFSLCTIFSGVCAESAPVNKPINKIQESGLKVTNNALADADEDFARLNAAKRKAAIAQEQAKLNPVVISNNGGGGGGSKNSEFAETIATNIVVDEMGRGFATLQFSDGSTLMVSNGDKVGKYTITNISLKGVYLGACDSKKKCSTRLIKRSYPVEPRKQGSNNNYTIPTQSTNVLPSSNNSSSSTQVPPIIGGGK